MYLDIVRKSLEKYLYFILTILMMNKNLQTLKLIYNTKDNLLKLRNKIYKKEIIIMKENTKTLVANTTTILGIGGMLAIAQLPMLLSGAILVSTTIGLAIVNINHENKK